MNLANSSHVFISSLIGTFYGEHLSRVRLEHWCKKLLQVLFQLVQNAFQLLAQLREISSDKSTPRHPS